MSIASNIFESKWSFGNNYQSHFAGLFSYFLHELLAALHLEVLILQVLPVQVEHQPHLWLLGVAKYLK